MIGDHRELGVIEKAHEGVEDHGLPIFTLGIAFQGAYQAFSLTFSKESLPAFARDVRQLFGVSSNDELVGLQCYALRCFSGFGAYIDGIETMDGKRLTRHGWVRKNLDPDTPTPLEIERDARRRALAAHRRAVLEYEARLSSVSDDYVDWEVAP